MDNDIIEKHAVVIKMSGIEFHVTSCYGDTYELCDEDIATIAYILNKKGLCDEEKAMMIHGLVRAPLHAVFEEVPER